MSSIFKKIKSAFVIEEGSPVVTSGDVQSDPTDSNLESTKTPARNESMDLPLDEGTISGEVNQKFTDILLKALEVNNQEGFDYFEFKRSLQNLIKMDMDEATVYKSAYATAQTLGATPNGLISSAQRYLTVLQKEEEKFKVALGNQKSKQIDGGLQEIKQFEQSIVDKKKQIEKLMEEIAQLETHLAKMKGEIQESAQKIESTRADFVASYSNLVSQINKDIENIGKYLN
jgi:ABC-type transporter Mla subunit MlaD